MKYLTKTNFLSGPASIDRFPVGGNEDELEVDVEQCSDSETPSRSRTPRTTSNNSRGTTPSPSDDERLTPEPVNNKKEEFIHFINEF